MIVVQPLIWVWTRAGRSPSVGRVDGELQRVVGRNIRRIRDGRGLSQEALADDIDVHRTFLGAVERGERNLTLQTVERLAQRLGVPTSALLGEGGGADGAGGPGGPDGPGCGAGTGRGPSTGTEGGEGASGTGGGADTGGGEGGEGAIGTGGGADTGGGEGGEGAESAVGAGGGAGTVGVEDTAGTGDTARTASG